MQSHFKEHQQLESKVPNGLNVYGFFAWYEPLKVRYRAAQMRADSKENQSKTLYGAPA